MFWETIWAVRVYLLLIQYGALRSRDFHDTVNCLRDESPLLLHTELVRSSPVQDERPNNQSLVVDHAVQAYCCMFVISSTIRAMYISVLELSISFHAHAVLINSLQLTDICTTDSDTDNMATYKIIQRFGVSCGSYWERNSDDFN